MRRFNKLVILVAMTAALILPISTVAATTTVDYNIAGVEYAATSAQGSFAGAAVSVSKTELGVWNAVVGHDLGGITGGTFAFKSKLHSFRGEITGGAFGTAVGNCAKTAIDVQGDLSGGGSFHVTLTHFGFMQGTTCVVYFATVRGTATLVFP